MKILLCNRRNTLHFKTEKNINSYLIFTILLVLMYQINAALMNIGDFILAFER